MTIEEKAKRYDEAVERAKSKIKNDKDHVLYEDDIIELFPELKESEYERVRKELLAVINDLTLPDEQQSRFVAWLEKQGENSPILYDSSNIGKNWSEEDDKIRKVLIDLVKNNGSYYYLNTIPKDDIFAWLESIAAMNIEKLQSRKARGVIGGSGDNR